MVSSRSVTDPTSWLLPRLDSFLGLFDYEPMNAPTVNNDGRAVLDLRGVVGYHIDADELAPILRDLDAQVLEVHIDSPGGSAWQGVAIYNALRQHSARVEVHVDSVAASAASIIAMAGDTITMHPGSMMMIHYARGTADGLTAEDCRALADLLDKTNSNMADIYTLRAGADKGAWLEVMAAETWFTGDEAIAAGLADDANPPAGTTAVDTETGNDDDDEMMAAAADVFGWRFAGRGDAPPPPLARLESGNGALGTTDDAEAQVTAPSPIVIDHPSGTIIDLGPLGRFTVVDTTRDDSDWNPLADLIAATAFDPLGDLLATLPPTPAGSAVTRGETPCP